MDRNDVNWRGYFPALTTPFDSHGALDKTAWRELLRWMVTEGMHGLVVTGSTGEWFSLQPDERKTLFELASDEVGGRIPLIACCSAFTPQEVIDYATTALALNFAGILVSPPPYIVPTEEEIFAFFRKVNDAVEIPLIIYNWPPGTGIDLNLAIIKRLAQLSNVVGLKHSTSQMNHFLEVLEAMLPTLRVFGIVPSNHSIALLHHVGGDGAIGAAGILGRDQPGFYEAVWEGDFDKARCLAARDQTVMRELLTPSYQGRYGHATSTFKLALNLRGLPGGHVRPPLLPLDEVGVCAVRRTLSKLGLL